MGVNVKKFINSPDTIVDDLLEGYGMACPYVKVDGRVVISRSFEKSDRVAIVTYGGSGNEPAMIGFVGEGMIDIHVVGEIFESPDPMMITDVVRRADKGKGVLLLTMNHSSDMLAGNMAMKNLRKLGVNVRQVITQEDVASAPRSMMYERRGLAGAIPMYHVLGAASEAGYTLEELETLANKYSDSMATIAVASQYATNPLTGKPFGTLAPDEIEIGMGQHGEGGGSGRRRMMSAKEITGLIIEMLIADLSLKSGDNVFVMINGSGATTYMEMMILYRECVRYLNKKGIKVVANMVGEFLTTQEQAGFQLNIAKWDSEIIRLWETPARSDSFTK